MIKKFTKDSTQYNYHNAIELSWLFLLSELIELFIVLKAYDVSNREYNIRRVIWILTMVGFLSLFIILISTASLLYVLNTIGVL